MVEQRDVDGLEGIADAAGDVYICLGRVGRTGGMIVDGDDCARLQLQAARRAGGRSGGWPGPALSGAPVFLAALVDAGCS